MPGESKTAFLHYRHVLASSQPNESSGQICAVHPGNLENLYKNQTKILFLLGKQPFLLQEIMFLVGYTYPKSLLARYVPSILATGVSGSFVHTSPMA